MRKKIAFNSLAASLRYIRTSISA